MMEQSQGRLSLTDEVYNQMLVKIAEGDWKPGERLPSEKTLCGMFGVSRVSVRSVLQRLQARGLIHTLQGVGSFVSKPEEARNEAAIETVLPYSGLIGGFSKEDVLSFFEFRQAIEFKAIDLFVVRAPEAAYKKLLGIICAVQECNDDFFVMRDRDFDFHMAITEGSENRYLIQTMLAYKADYLKFVEQVHKIMGETSKTWTEAHMEIYQNLIYKRPSEVKRITLEANAVRKLLMSKYEE